jgi:small subunit ribosomal protein S9
VTHGENYQYIRKKEDCNCQSNIQRRQGANKIARHKIMEALSFVDDKGISKIDINVNVHGGGVIGQADAVRTAVGKGIVEWTGDLAVKDAMLSYDRNLLVNDSRQKETKKFGGSGARAKAQKSYR